MSNQTHFARAILESEDTFTVYAWNAKWKTFEFDAKRWINNWWDTSALTVLYEIQSFLINQPDPQPDSNATFIPTPAENALSCVDLIREEEFNRYAIVGVPPHSSMLVHMLDAESITTVEFEERNGVRIPVTRVRKDPEAIRKSALECASAVLLTSIYRGVHDFNVKDIYFNPKQEKLA